jgi:acetyl-CoA synthetase
MAVEEREASESQIAVHWREEDYYHLPAKFIAQANAGDPSILDRFNEERFRNALRNTRPCSTGTPTGNTTLDTSNPPFWRGFVVHLRREAETTPPTRLLL